jgi:hypothetical protein
MKDLIEALTIMLQKGDVDYPTNCMHDELGVFPQSMDFTPEEFTRLEELGFDLNEDEDGFMSYKFGSC